MFAQQKVKGEACRWTEIAAKTFSPLLGGWIRLWGSNGGKRWHQDYLPRTRTCTHTHISVQSLRSCGNRGVNTSGLNDVIPIQAVLWFPSEAPVTSQEAPAVHKHHPCVGGSQEQAQPRWPTMGFRGAKGLNQIIRAFLVCAVSLFRGNPAQECHLLCYFGRWIQSGHWVWDLWVWLCSTSLNYYYHSEHRSNQNWVANWLWKFIHEK